jgi:phosphatidylinositol glycan class Q protein
MLGKKKNVLKDRIDTGEFGVDEILIGILILTPLIFLTPTIGMYYLCFVITWL